MRIAGLVFVVLSMIGYAFGLVYGIVYWIGAPL